MSADGETTVRPAEGQSAPESTDLLAEYGELHRGLLQLVVACKTLPEAVLIQFLKQSVEEADQDTLKQVLTRINRKLAELDLAIDNVTDDGDNAEPMYMFVNRKSTKPLQLATQFTEKEMKVISHLIGMIFATPRENGAHWWCYSVPKYTVESDIRQKFTYTLTEVQHLMKRLMLDGWVEVWKSGYTVSPRALSELKPYLEENFPETAVPCHGCGQIITRGVSCVNKRCTTRYHHSCYTLYKEGTVDQVCPGCGEPLTDVKDF